MFIATCLCLTHGTGDDDTERIPKRYLDHLPNLYTPAGLVDYFAIRTFAVLFPALCSDSYPYIFRDGKDKLLPINPDVWAEVQYAWELAMQLENMVHTGWDIVITKPCAGIEHLDFHRIADVSFILRSHNHAQLTVVCRRPYRCFIVQISRGDRQGAG
jgi:hypothetical protein